MTVRMTYAEALADRFPEVRDEYVENGIIGAEGVTT